MPDIVLGDVVVKGYTIWDQNNNPLTGMVETTDVVFYLHRRSSSASAMVAATEDVTLTEIGVTGHYSIVFTPQNLGEYRLQIEEINVNTNLQIMAWDFNVLPAGAVFLPSFANAFCAESDIERYLGRTISATTNPTATMAAGYAEEIAAILSSIAAKRGHSITPTTVTAGSRIEDILRAANAIGAARFYVVAQQLGHSPNVSEQYERLGTLWEEYVRPGNGKDIAPGYLIEEIKGNLASLSTDHILSGDTLANPDTTAPYALPIGVTMGDLF